MIVIIGLVNSGKSTLANAIVGINASPVISNLVCVCNVKRTTHTPVILGCPQGDYERIIADPAAVGDGAPVAYVAPCCETHRVEVADLPGLTYDSDIPAELEHAGIVIFVTNSHHMFTNDAEFALYERISSICRTICVATSCETINKNQAANIAAARARDIKVYAISSYRVANATRAGMCVSVAQCPWAITEENKIIDAPLTTSEVDLCKVLKKFIRREQSHADHVDIPSMRSSLQEYSKCRTSMDIAIHELFSTGTIDGVRPGAEDAFSAVYHAIMGNARALLSNLRTYSASTSTYSRADIGALIDRSYAVEFTKDMVIISTASLMRGFAKRDYPEARAYFSKTLNCLGAVLFAPRPLVRLLQICLYKPTEAIAHCATHGVEINQALVNIGATTLDVGGIIEMVAGLDPNAITSHKYLAFVESLYTIA